MCMQWALLDTSWSQQSAKQWTKNSAQSLLTFIIDFEAVGTDGEVTGEPQGEHRPCACDWRWDLETC